MLANLFGEFGKSPCQLRDNRQFDYRHCVCIATAKNSVLAQQFLTELREKHDVDEALFLIDGPLSLQDACSRQDLDLRDERYGDRNSVERVFREVKRHNFSFLNCVSNTEADTADEWLQQYTFA